MSFDPQLVSSNEYNWNGDLAQTTPTTRPCRFLLDRIPDLHQQRRVQAKGKRWGSKRQLASEGAKPRNEKN